MMQQQSYKLVVGRIYQVAALRSSVLKHCPIVLAEAILEDSALLAGEPRAAAVAQRCSDEEHVYELGELP